MELFLESHTKSFKSFLKALEIATKNIVRDFMSSLASSPQRNFNISVFSLNVKRKLKLSIANSFSWPYMSCLHNKPPHFLSRHSDETKKTFEFRAGSQFSSVLFFRAEQSQIYPPIRRWCIRRLSTAPAIAAARHRKCRTAQEAEEAATVARQFSLYRSSLSQLS